MFTDLLGTFVSFITTIFQLNVGNGIKVGDIFIYSLILGIVISVIVVAMKGGRD